MELFREIPNGYISIRELSKLTERSVNTIRKRLEEAGVPGKVIRLSRKNVRIYPQREALYAALDE